MKETKTKHNIMHILIIQLLIIYAKYVLIITKNKKNVIKRKLLYKTNRL